MNRYELLHETKGTGLINYLKNGLENSYNSMHDLVLTIGYNLVSAIPRFMESFGEHLEKISTSKDGFNEFLQSGYATIPMVSGMFALGMPALYLTLDIPDPVPSLIAIPSIIVGAYLGYKVGLKLQDKIIASGKNLSKFNLKRKESYGKRLKKNKEPYQII